MAIFNHHIWVLLLSYLVACLFWGLAFPALMAALTSDPDREFATTVFSVMGSLGWAVGAALMGPAEEVLGPAGLFAASFLVLLAFPLCLALDRLELPPVDLS